MADVALGAGNSSNSGWLRRTSTPIALIVAIAIGSLVIFLANTGSIALVDRDEGRYAEIGREMFVSHNYLVPSLLGVPYLEKPPMLYWLLAGSYSVFGLNELAARLPIALAASLGVILVGIFARRVIDPWAGVYSAAILATTGLYVVLARVVLTDMLFAVSLSGALMSYFLADKGLVREYPGFAAFWLGLAVSTLSKGPAALLLCCSIILAHHATGRSIQKIRQRALWMCGLLYLAMVLPWFWMIQWQYPSFARFYIFDQHLARFGGAEHREPFYFFVPFLVAGLLPWTPVVIAAVSCWTAHLKSPTADREYVRFLILWSLIVFGVFSASGGKLVPYILPMFPAVALLLGGTVREWLKGGMTRTLAVVGFCTSGILVCALGVATAVTLEKLQAPGVTWLVLATILGAIIMTAGLSGRFGGGWQFGTVALSSALLYLAAAAAAPGIYEAFTAKSQLVSMRKTLQPDDEIAMTEVYYPSEAFYLGRIPYVVDPNRELGYGLSLVGGSPRLIPDLSTLKERTRGKELFCLTGVSPKYIQRLEEHFPDLHILSQNRAATIVMIRNH